MFYELWVVIKMSPLLYCVISIVSIALSLSIFVDLSSDTTHAIVILRINITRYFRASNSVVLRFITELHDSG